jgi:serine beta-lactamase-like protein LACTB, mitochondrial
MADLSRGIRATPQTAYRIGSVTKVLTAALLMRLVEDGRLDLDTPISNYITLSAPLQALTLRQLAGHLGGVRHYRANEFFTNTAYPTLRAALEIFESDTLIAPPGTRYAYSSYGYNLIGAVIESITRKPFATSLRELVLEPLQMRNTSPDEKGREIAGRAQVYAIPNQGDVTNAPEDDLSSRWPSGGYLSSTDDLARLGRTMFSPGFLEPASIQLMVTPQRLVSGTQTTVGIAWRVGIDSTGRNYYHHGGTSNGGSAFLLVYPERQLVVAVAANAFGQLSEREARTVAAFFLRQ